LPAGGLRRHQTHHRLTPRILRRAAWPRRVARRASFFLRAGSGRAGARQVDRERGALPKRALDGDTAAVGLDDLAHDPQAEPEPAVVALRHRALEAAEDAALV